MDETRKIDRRMFLKIAGIGLVGAACSPAAAPTPTPTKAPAPTTAAPGAAPTAAAAKPEQLGAQLYEAAKKEGQVVVYSTGTSKDMDAYRKVFSTTYPGIELKEFMGTGEQIGEKMLTEFKSNRVNVDVFILPLEQWPMALKEGLVEKWEAPERINYPANAVDPNGFYVIEQSTIHVISHNTSLVPAANAPRNYQDLLNPVLKGKVGLEREAYSWFTQRMKIWGREKAIDYAKKLAAQQPKFIKGHTNLAEAVVSGEVWAAVNVYQQRVEEQKGKGAPVQWVVDEPTGAEPLAIGLAKNAPHPNAGKLHLDWRLSSEGQSVTYKTLNRYPLRKDASLPKELQVKVALPSLELVAEAAENAKIFKEIFGLI